MDRQQLRPTSSSSTRSLDFDLPGLRIGCAEYREGPTGCSVFLFDKAVRCAADLRGGSTCSVLLDGWDTGDALVNAICLTGGSCCGVEAIGGTVTTLFNSTPNPTDFTTIPRVMGAVIYDYRPRKNHVYPDRALAEYAVRDARAGTFPLGPHGVGCSASVGKGPQFDLWEIAGQGAAFRDTGKFKVAVFTVVNSIGAILDRSGQPVRGFFHRTENRRYSPSALAGILPSTKNQLENTTLTLVVTDLSLPSYQLRQFGRQVHSSMARAIQPFHSVYDGDILFTVSLDQRPATQSEFYNFPIVAAEAAWDAVLSSFDPS